MVNLNMTNEIASALLTQAKNHLADGDFESAAKAARGVIALDEDNSTAMDILTASEAAIGAGEQNDEAEPPRDPELTPELESLMNEVANTTTAQGYFTIEASVQSFVMNNSDNSLAVKLLTQVSSAREQYVKSKQSQSLWGDRRSSRASYYEGTGGGADKEAGCLNYGISFLLASFLGLLIQYIFRTEGWLGVGINAVIFVISIWWFFG